MGISHHGSQKGDWVRLRPLIKDALFANAWLYHKPTGKWWTPEEFEGYYNSQALCNHDIDQLLENTIIRPASSGIAAGEKQIINEAIQYSEKVNALKEKLEAFKLKDRLYREYKEKRS